MNKLLLLFFLVITGTVFCQVPPYYDPVDLGLTGMALRDELGDHVTSTHTDPTSYSEVWEVLKLSDLDPENASNVLLMYGYNDDDGSVINDRTRDKDANGGSPGEWNREHVFPKSLAEPELGTSGAGADPHNLRASDVQMNGDRGNKQYADATGNAGTVGSYWYPGDEWKGDAARIIMYMYIRYENRCKPNAVAIGSTNAVDPQMVNILLEWNAEDPVSEHEDDRNNAIYSAIGNRNPFIDNPYFATLIWGGTVAEDRWGNLSLSTTLGSTSFMLYPNPVENGLLHITGLKENSELYLQTIDGQQVSIIQRQWLNNQLQLNVTHLPNGIYLLIVQNDAAIETRKVIIQ